jgi:hypothetical protein
MTFDQILDRVWLSHNPCSSAWSRQYMSAIFYDGEAQKKAILAGKARMEEKLGKPVKTAILPLGRFYLAEDYHQKYELRGTAELMKEFTAIYPDSKDFVNSTAAARVNSYIGGGGSKEQLQKEIDLLGLSPEGKKTLQKYVTR